MAQRFYIEANGCGGWQVRDRRDGDRVVSSSAFRTFCDKAVSRLRGESGWTLAEAFRFYGVRA